MGKVTWIFWGSMAALAVVTPALAAGPTVCFTGVRLVVTGPDAPQPDESAAISAAAGVGSARIQLHRLAIEMSRQFESSSDYEQAKLSALRACSAYQAAKEEDRLRVQSSPEGMAGQVEIDRLERQLDEARQQAKLAGRDPSEKIDAITLDLLKERSAMSRREAEAVAADEKLANLRYAWLDAHAKLQAMRDDFAQQIRSDPGWKNAKAQLDQVVDSFQR